MSEMTVNEANFEQEVLQSDLPVLVDFWADWCGPCKMLAPTVEQIANEYEGKIRVAKINVDDSQALAAEYGVMSIPTLVLFREGQVVKQSIGVKPKQVLIQELGL